MEECADGQVRSELAQVTAFASRNRKIAASLADVTDDRDVRFD